MVNSVIVLLLCVSDCEGQTMNTYQILHGDATEQLRTLPADSVHCVVTSPPYWGLRDYGVDGQIGLEETPEAYVARLVEVFREVRRVLRDEGVCWLNLGDSYSGNATSGGENQNPGGHAFRVSGVPTKRGDGLKPKDLVGIPWRVAFALQADGWWLRQDIIWSKTAPMPESVTDRCTKAHEYVFLLTKSARYYYDAQAVSEPSVDPEGSAKRYEQPFFVGNKHEAGGYSPNGAKHTAGMKQFNGTRNRRSVWTLGPEPYAEAHFATMPSRLAELCILAGTSARGCCPQCGAPWERVVERETRFEGGSGKAGRSAEEINASGKYRNGGSAGNANLKLGPVVDATTTGWQPTCECFGHFEDVPFANDPKRTWRKFFADVPVPGPIPCTVLDPFSGSGTTVATSITNGRNGIGIELNAEYIALAERRITGTQPALFGVGV